MRRNPWMRVAATVSAMAAVLLLAASWRFLQSRGVFTSVEEKTPGVCRSIDGLRDVRDIVPGPFDRAYIAAADGLYVYSNGMWARFGGTPKDFHPAALSLTSSGDLHVLFRQTRAWKISVFATKFSEVISGSVLPPHPSQSSWQFVTKPVPPKVDEIGRLSTDVLTDPADLVSLDGNRFYLINRHTSRSALGRWLDDAFLLPRANVLYYDSMKFVTVAERLNSPAGLALSRDGGRLYVAEDYPRTLASFSRNDFMGSLDNPAVLSLSANPQKITVASDGSLIVVARPKAGAGQAYRVTVENGVPQKAVLLYSHKGEGVTAAAQLGRHLLIGTPSRLLDCVSTN